jgi:hypothetical protein
MRANQADFMRPVFWNRHADIKPRHSGNEKREEKRLADALLATA